MRERIVVKCSDLALLPSHTFSLLPSTFSLLNTGIESPYTPGETHKIYHVDDLSETHSRLRGLLQGISGSGYLVTSTTTAP
jgi:hypothetical protein